MTFWRLIKARPNLQSVIRTLHIGLRATLYSSSFFLELCLSFVVAYKRLAFFKAIAERRVCSSFSPSTKPSFTFLFMTGYFYLSSDHCPVDGVFLESKTYAGGEGTTLLVSGGGKT